MHACPGRRVRRARRERPAGEVPPAGPSASCRGRGFASGPIGVAAHTAPARHRGAGRYRRGIVPCGPLRVLGHCPAGRSDEGVFPRPGGSADGGACATSADRGAGARPEGRPCRAVLRSGAARLLGSALYALRVISPGASDGFLCAVGWSEAGFLSLCAASRFGFLLVTESAYVDYNLKAIYSSLAQCGCRGLCESLILARTFGACKV